MTDEQKKLKAERDRRYREKKKSLEQKPNDQEIQPVKPQPVEHAAAPSQLDRIEALLLELVQTNRKVHPNISEALGGFKG
jgi:hypothetical protein